ncbi:hypothetical protein COT75_03515 [Candidatus Beckwithbacteria bacterium CG10_big_fil_rev_8_21_14_0_10_34_10]|uniref:Peptidase M16 C-terminal domain-containing protein n=1 Tax=Candidatus Beckwithbacteria bacterium CG10_big_fil_rev_8_21_14_0_10_34_10 TaxID=1974495 RepID=A0A2H0W8R8_9BACT|nr:MAG: hypothetical protein COT75_03515 [Candidatus Beckwithbacteria bacterium CG10_big_fil_rev_8_21_14_0_10_34_10]
MAKIQTHIFQNGLPALYIPAPSASVYTAVFTYGAGTRFETQEKEGISRFYTNICLQGNQEYPDKNALAEAIDKLGLSFRTTVSPEYTMSYFSSAEELFVPSLKLVLKLYLKPSLTEEALEAEKKLNLAEVEFTQRNPQFKSLNQLLLRVFPNSSLGFNLLGTQESLNNIDLNSLQEFKNKYFVSQNCLLTILGPKKNFSFASLNNVASFLPEGPRQEFAPVDFNQIQTVQEKESQPGQASYLSYASLCFGRNSNQRVNQSLLINILSEGRNNKRLNILQKNLLTSSVKPWIKIFSDTGLFLIQAVAPATKEEELKTALQEELTRLITTNPINQEELNQAKAYYQNSLLQRLDNSLEKAMFYSLGVFFNLEDQSPEQIIKKMKQITLEDINQTAQAIFKPDFLSFVIVGPGF